MASVRGLTVEIGGTTTKLGQALDKVKSTASVLNTELRTTDKLLKFEASDKVSLLSGKLDKLKASSAGVAKEIELLNKGVEANKKAFDAGKISQEEYDKRLAQLNKQLVTATGRYDVLQAEITQTTSDLKAAKDSTEGNANFLKKMAEAADEAGVKSNLLSTIIKGNLISSAITTGLNAIVSIFKAIAQAAADAAKVTWNYMKDAINLAADYEDALGYSEQVFGANADFVKKWAEDNSLALRLNKKDTLESINTFGSMFRAVGASNDKATEMSTTLVQLAADMRAATGTDINQVLENLRSVMTGGAQAGYKYGLVIKDTAVKAKALQMGLVQTAVDMTDVNRATLNLEKSQKALADAVKKHGENSLEYRAGLQKVTEAENALEEALAGKNIALTEAQMQEARYALILDQSATMQGQAARESGNYKSQIALFNTQLENLKISIGEKLLPVATEIMKQANEFFQSEEGKKLLDDLTEGIGNITKSILDFLQGEDFKKFKDEQIPKIEEFIQGVIDKLPEISQWAKDNLPKMISDLGKILDYLARMIDYLNKPGLLGLKNLPDVTMLQKQRGYLYTDPVTGKPMSFRASGGSVLAGNPYIVGERGMEIFVPNVSGSIIPNHQIGGFDMKSFANEIKNSVLSALRDGSQMSDSSIILNNVMTLDGNVVYKNQQKIARQKGKSLIVGGTI